jgi:hypothetical protein
MQNHEVIRSATMATMQATTHGQSALRFSDRTARWLTATGDLAYTKDQLSLFETAVRMTARGRHSFVFPERKITAAR